MISYNKTRSTIDKNKLITWYLSEKIEDLLVKYLSLIRSMETFISKQIECETFDKYEKILFVNDEKVWKRNHISDIFKNQMNEWVSMSMRIQKYRQLTKLWMRIYLKQVEEREDVRDAQSEHTSHTIDMRYDISSENMNELTSDKLLRFFYVNQKWHRLLRFKVKD